MPSPDAGMAAPDAAPGDGGFACRNAVPNAQLGSGHHNAGQDCQNGCHNHGFTLSGTMFSTATGNTPVTGATITVTDAAGQTFDVVTQLDGNFYTTNPVTFPVTVVASRCPSVQPMLVSLSSTQGGCNQTGCHQPGAQGWVRLP